MKEKVSIKQSDIDKIVRASIFESSKWGDKTTIVNMQLPNGFVLTEASSCVDPRNFDMAMGENICKTKLVNKIWELEGYYLQKKESDHTEDISVGGCRGLEKAEQKDPWKHRSKGMKCKTCMWFVDKAPKVRPKVGIGRCRSHAPTMNGYPVVFVGDWCGDHKLNEEAV
jgi:hypothetical protein